MILKSRDVPEELKLLRYLNSRMQFSAKELNHYHNLEKGFAGEKLFDVWLESLPDDGLILNDFILESNNTLFQIDTLLIAEGMVYLFEVKNYEGDFYIENDNWYTAASQIEIKNPLLQLKRSDALLRRLLKELGYNLPIKSFIIFINPDFHLYQAPLNLPAIFPSQIGRFIEKFKVKTSNTSAKQIKLAERLLSNCLKEYPFMRIPDYTFEQLEKGITCRFCYSFLIPFNKNNFICKNCGCKEKMDSAVLRSVEEFKTLFPDRKITANTIYQWCDIVSSTKVVYRILSRHYRIHGYGKYSFYINKQINHEK